MARKTERPGLWFRRRNGVAQWPLSTPLTPRQTDSRDRTKIRRPNGIELGLWQFRCATSCRLDPIDVLEDEGFVNAEELHYRSNQRRVSMAIGHEDVCALARHRQMLVGPVRDPSSRA